MGGTSKGAYRRWKAIMWIIVSGKINRVSVLVTGRRIIPRGRVHFVRRTGHEVCFDPSNAKARMMALHELKGKPETAGSGIFREQVDEEPASP